MITKSNLLRLSAAAISLAAIFAARPAPPPSPTVDPQLYAGLTWRNLGPFRAGRVSAVTGVIGQPGVFYMGLPAGGVWKTTSAGQTWYPIFDAIREVSSIGAIEVAPSDPNVIYVGTGDMITGGAINEGNGVYKSTDAGRTWRHIGLDSTKQIPSMLVGINNPNDVLLAAQGDVHVPSGARGVFRSTDGGTTWTRTLFIDDSTGVQKLARANDVPDVIFATSVRHYSPPPSPNSPVVFSRSAAPDTGRTQTRVFKSTDGGVQWTEINGTGLPRLNGRTSIAVAMKTNAQRVFLISNSGLYRSDDGGSSWRQMAADDDRIRNGQGGYNSGVYVSPSSPDVVYTISTSSYISTDGGKTFTGFKGAPGGDDPQQLWIDPTNGQRMLMGLDQGGVVTLDGGATWSSYYNQSTEQVYHVAADNSFPYYIYATQQDAGAIRTRSRGNLGAVTPLDWDPVNGWEWGTIQPDPLNPNLVYSSGNGIDKIFYPSEQWTSVSPAIDPANRLRTASSQPIVFAPWDKHTLIAGFQQLMSTTDGGATWSAMSPDLATRADAPAPPGGGAPSGGAIESISPSTVAAGVIWVGTNNGLIKLTTDGGKTWSDASVPDLPNAARAEVTIDASHTDPASAYAAVTSFRATGDYKPYIFRTHDSGKTWTKIVEGLPVDEPSGSFARVVRADTKKAGLLFAATESGMYVSFDDGDHWQSLIQNLPNTSFRDITIKDNDLIVGTYGRGIWVLDDYSLLRQLTPAIAKEQAHLFKPGDAVRLRRNVGQDTPFPPEVPHALNPLDGVIVDYWLARAPSKKITLDVFDASGALVRHMTSAAKEQVPEGLRPPHPNFWVAPVEQLPARAGDNRTNWDLRYDSPPSFVHSIEINANPGLTPVSPLGPLVLPGAYTLKLSVDGKTYSQTVNVLPDPRSPATASELAAQHALQMKIYDGINASYEGYQAAEALQKSLISVTSATAQPAIPELAARLSALSLRIDTVGGLDAQKRRARVSQSSVPSFYGINRILIDQLSSQDQADIAPTKAMAAAFDKTCNDLAAVISSWQRVAAELGSVNTLLTGHGRAAIKLESAALKAPSCS